MPDGPSLRRAISSLTSLSGYQALPVRGSQSRRTPKRERFLRCRSSGRGVIFGPCGAWGLLAVLAWVWDGTANPYRSYSKSRPNARKRAPAVRRDQSRDCGAVWAPIRLWSLTLRLCWWNGLTNKTSQAFPREYVFESSSSLAHLGNSPEG